MNQQESVDPGSGNQENADRGHADLPGNINPVEADQRNDNPGSVSSGEAGLPGKTDPPNLRCIIVDDEYLAIRILEEYSARIPALTILQSFKDPLQALGFLQNNKVDLLFLDIQMPHISGTDLAGRLSADVELLATGPASGVPLDFAPGLGAGLPISDAAPGLPADSAPVPGSAGSSPAPGWTASAPPLIVFTTARHEFAVQAFELDALDYLVKPISFERFEKTIRKAVEYLGSPARSLPAHASGPNDASSQNAPSPQDALFIKSDHRTVKLLYTEIVLIEGLNEYVRVHTPGKKIITLAALKDLEATLPRGRFVRIHRSYIISLAHIRSWSASEVEMGGGLRLPVGRVYKENFLRQVML